MFWYWNQNDFVPDAKPGSPLRVRDGSNGPAYRLMPQDRTPMIQLTTKRRVRMVTPRSA